MIDDGTGLRELGLGLDDVRQVLAWERTVAEVAAAHVTALDAQILPQRGDPQLKVIRAVLSTVARRGAAAGFNDRVARYRELLAVVNRQPAPPHAEDFAWVVAALRARAAG